MSSRTHQGTQQETSPFVCPESGLPNSVQFWFLKQPCKLDPVPLGSSPKAVLPTQGPGGRHVHLCPQRQACRTWSRLWTLLQTCDLDLGLLSCSPGPVLPTRDLSSDLAGATPTQVLGNRLTDYGPYCGPSNGECDSLSIAFLFFQLPSQKQECHG